MSSIPAEKNTELKQTIQQKVTALVAMIDDTAVVRNAQQLHDTEKRIAAITDEIAGHVIEAVVDRSVHDDALNAEAKALPKQSPVRMKNKGARPVEIQPYRGQPFRVDADYYAKAGQSAKKANKKGGSTHS
jgi:hypothetical protein